MDVHSLCGDLEELRRIYHDTDISHVTCRSPMTNCETDKMRWRCPDGTERKAWIVELARWMSIDCRSIDRSIDVDVKLYISMT